MSSTPRVLVIGGGAAGLSTALNLKELGCTSVTLVERSHLISGSSGLSVGVFTRQYAEEFDVELRVDAFARMREFVDAGAIHFADVGFIRLAHDAETIRVFEESVAVQNRLGVPDSRVIDADEIKRLVPDMETEDLVGGIYSPTDGYLDGHVLCQIYAERCEAAGVRLLTRTSIESVEGGKGQPFRVKTSDGLLEADIVVNAAGAWADQVGKLLGAPVPVHRHRKQLCLGHFPRPLGYAMPYVMDYVPGHTAPGMSWRDEGNQNFIVGLHTNVPVGPGVEDPDNYKKAVDDEYILEIAERLMHRFPGMPDVGLKEGWTGLYPMSPDGKAIVGPHPEDDGIVVVGGLGGFGIMLSPSVGRLAAEWILFGEFRAVKGAESLTVGRFDLTAAG